MSAPTLRGPAWVTLRLHRRSLWAGAALLLLAAGVLLYQRLHSAAVAGDFAGTGCSVDLTTRACGGAVRSFLDTEFAFRQWLGYLGLVLLVLPGAVGAFVAGPVIARELETGTYKLAWTQSVSPARWLAAKLVMPAVWTVAGVSALTGLFRWAWTTGPDSNFPLRWYEPVLYPALGPVTMGYALLGIAVGALAGLLVRRTVLAMSVTALTLGLVTALFSYRLRGHLWPPLTVIGDQTFRADLHDGMMVVNGPLSSSGERLRWEDCTRDSPCAGEKFYVDYHPASHFWPLQLVETGILLALAALITYAAFRALRRLHA